MGLVTLKLVCDLHQKWGTFLPNLGTPDLWVLELFAMYATDGRTDGQTDRWTKATCTAPFPMGGGIINIYKTYQLVVMVRESRYLLHVISDVVYKHAYVSEIGAYPCQQVRCEKRVNASVSVGNGVSG